MNYITESDNLIALERLLLEYEGKIDVMPIDPPYNTDVDGIGYKDSNYDDGWISFMRPRLEIAYRLLSPRGIMFIHIDENEFHTLWSLCSNIFGVGNLISMIWKKTNPCFDKNRKEKPLESGIRRTHEFVIACFKDRNNTTLKPILQPVWDGNRYTEVLQPLETVLDDMGTTSSAKDELAELMGDRNIFSTPKPIKLIKELYAVQAIKTPLLSISSPAVEQQVMQQWNSMQKTEATVNLFSSPTARVISAAVLQSLGL